ncbi:MAG: autotransporter-associated beta strand repeat-containing protein [Verrucomicrobiota bacterium]
MPCLPTVDGRHLELSTAALAVHQFSPRRVTRLLTLLALVLPATTLPAAITNYTWSPSVGGNARWTRAGNWAFNNPPPAGTISGLTNTDVTFAGTSKTTSLLDQNFYLHALLFAPSAGAFTLMPQSNEMLYLGAGGVTNNSASTQTFLNGVTVSADQLWAANAGNLVFGGAVNLLGNDLTIAGSFNTTIQGMISGGGSLIKEGAGNLTLSGTLPNLFTGGLTLNSGTITVAKNNALGAGPLTLNGGVLNLGAYNLTVSSISLRGGTINSSSGGITSSSDYQLQSGTVSTRLGGTGGLIKTTSGTVTLTAANTYSGGTQIRAGRLTVNNATGSGTGTGPVLIGSGGLLAGTGTVTGFVTNAPGGSISAGNEIGVLNLGSTFWFGGATNRWDLANATGTAGGGWDLLNINGTLTLAATALDKALIDVTSFTLGGVPGLAANFDPTQNYLWTFVQTTGGIIFQPGNDATSVFELVVGNFVNPTLGGRFGVELSADGLSLVITYNSAIPIPEPNMTAATLLGLGSLIFGHRLRRNR